MRDFNNTLERILREHIKSLSKERESLERNKNFRKIPYEVKEIYYKGYDSLMEFLYELLYDLIKGSQISFEEYNDLMSSSNALSEYLMTILDSYGIKYTNI